MFIGEERQSTVVILSPEGRLDTMTAPELERKVWRLEGNIKVVILNFSMVTYISSLGLRVLLQIQKIMKERQGKMFIKNINQSLLSIFEMTGLMALFIQEEKMVLLRKEKSKTKLTLSLSGKVDDETAPALEKELYQEGNEFSTIYLDCAQLNGVSSRGFEVLVGIQKNMAKKNGRLVLQHINESVQAMIEAAGLTGVLIQEENMLLQKDVAGAEVLLSFIGRLDTETLPNLQQEMSKLEPDVTKITLDFSQLTYISKEGFRIFLQLQTDLQQKGVALEIKL
ncbi:MAG: STAS domain-containing protein [Treponema sp.]|jgi:anti-anti-sigma factor|nr:STAS domain-containing protein [Treponema sp.]